MSGCSFIHQPRYISDMRHVINNSRQLQSSSEKNIKLHFENAKTSYIKSSQAWRNNNDELARYWIENAKIELKIAYTLESIEQEKNSVKRYKNQKAQLDIEIKRYQSLIHNHETKLEKLRNIKNTISTRPE